MGAPDGSVSSESAFCSLPNTPGCSSDKSGLTYRSVKPFTKIERHWINLTFSGSDILAPNGIIAFNPVVDKEYTTLTDAQGNNLQMSAKFYTFDYNGNVTQETHYDWFDPALVTRDSVGVPTGVPAGATILKQINYTHFNQASGASSTNVYAKRSFPTGSPLILNALQQTTLGSSIVQLSYDGQAYGVAPTVGNVTTKKVWVDVDSKWITTSNTYDAYGNVLTSTDGRGKITQFFYDDATHAVPNRVVVDPQNGTATQTATTAFDFSTGLVTSQTDVNGQVSTIDYTNQLLGTVDPFGRPGITKSPTVNIGGTNHQRRVTTKYLDSARQLIVETDLNAENDKLLKTRTTSDMLGRPLLTESTEDGTNYTISVKNAYLEMGRVTLTSSAMRSTAASSDSWTRVTKDTAGRPIEVATFGGAAQPAWTGTGGVFTGALTTAYSANLTTVTDQAGKVRRSMVDALGRLTRVDEPDAGGNLGLTTSPVQPTSYIYNVFDNLTTVTQGSQTRTFTYDSVSRLRSAVNPESGTINYQYDDNGNLLVKTEARGVSVHYEYDSLNRVTRRWYNGSNLTSSTTHNSPVLPSGVGATDEVKFYYDSQALPAGAPSYSRGSAVGRLVAQTYGAASNGDYYAFDVLGRPTLKIQQIGTSNYQMSAVYNLAGAVTSLTYPCPIINNCHTINNSYDQLGRLSAFSGNLGDGVTRTYSTGILYAPIGGLVKEQFGTSTPIYNKLFYNSRGQLAEMRVSTSYTGPTDTTWNRGAIVNHYSYQCWGMCSGLSMTDNNGNLRKQDVYIPHDDQISGVTARWQEYGYDSLNRLQWVREILNDTEYWKQQFTYDRWGNRTINTSATYGTGINNKAFTVTAANNRLGVPGGQSGVMQYDAAGNLTNDTYTGAGNRTYDAENKITSAWGGNNQAQLYGYDGSGQRIKRTVDGVQTWQVYGFSGELLAEYAANAPEASPQKEYGYRNGQLLIVAEPNAPGGTGHSLSLNGTSNYAQASSSTSLNITGAITVEAWIKLNAITGSYQDVITRESYGQAGTGGGYELSVTNNGKVRLDLFQSPTQTVWLISNTVMTTGAWHHIAGVFDGSQIRIYLDGALDGTLSTSSAPASGTSMLRIGRSSLGTFFGGLIDEARVSNAALYTSTFTPANSLTASSSTKGLWKFDGQTLNDSSGNSNHGTLVSGSYSTDVPTGGGSGVTTENVVWAGPVNVSVNGNSITKSAATAAWDAGANSTKAIVSGDGYVEMTVTETNKDRFFGLSDTENSITYSDIDFSMRAYSIGVIYCYEPGTNGAFCGYSSPGMKLRVAIEGGLVKYYVINGTTATLVYTATNTPTYPMAADAALYDSGATVTNAVISGNLNSGTAAQVKWLVPDHLGTPRMIIDITGNLANMKRHDYLPFGEELFAPVVGRTAAHGYSGGDGLRQQFTSKERDIETGLDYFLARYYSSTQGRFTSADELASPTNPIAYADPQQPQSLNKYQYVSNNPINTTDPDGHCPENQPCPTTSVEPINPTGPRDGRAVVGDVTIDIVISAGKVSANLGIGVNNFSNFFLNNNDPANAVAPYEPTSKVQTVAMHALEVLTLVGPLIGGFGPATTLTANSRQTTAVAAETANTAERASTLRPGPFATESIPARGPQRSWNAAERNFAESPGVCHTCGTSNPGTRSGRWSLDHQPVSALNFSNQPQNLFRQCSRCYHVQGGQTRVALQRQFDNSAFTQSRFRFR